MPDPLQHTGEATYYDADGTGACSFAQRPVGQRMVAAMNAVEWANSAVCGECVEVTGPQGTVTVSIVDKCPECAAGALDLSPEAFAGVAPLASGRVAITWTQVPCEVTGPVEWFFKDGSNPYWVALQLRNHRYPVASMAVEMNGQFIPMQRQDYNFFILTSPAAAPSPLHVRATDVFGHVVEDQIPSWSGGAGVMGSAQFNASCGG